MSDPRSTLAITVLVLTACGDSGGGTTGDTMVTSVSASATSSSGDAATVGTTQPERPTTGDTSTGTTTSGSSSDATTGTTAIDATTGTSSETSATGDPDTTAGRETTGTGTSTGGAVCGDGVVDRGETCDDGQGVGCDSYHDGGDGVCLPAGECSRGFILAMGACVAELATDHVHIMVDNTCQMTVEPAEFTVPAGGKLRLDYHNHSQDYAVDVWMMYGGGFTDLAPGATWSEKYEHCFGPVPSEGWAEISTACSNYKLPIHCL